jgi:hypothetical protein
MRVTMPPPLLLLLLLASLPLLIALRPPLRLV